MSTAAELLYRSQSAISLQIQQLEGIVGAPLLRRHARGVSLTREGEVIVAYADRILRLAHELMESMDQELVSGTVRFGLTEDYAVGRLPHLLREFSEMPHSIEIQCFVANQTELERYLDEDRIDLALAATDYMSREPLVHWTSPLLWVASRHFTFDKNQPLPLITITENEQRWESRVFETLDDCGIPWRIVYSSSRFAPLFVAAEAGLGLAFMIGECLRPSLRTLGETDGLPELPSVEFGFFASQPTPTREVTALMKLLMEALLHAPTSDL
jgi:DNA-binding transcriptional LysR family regulator